jgi:hypothetical protein
MSVSRLKKPVKARRRSRKVRARGLKGSRA